MNKNIQYFIKRAFDIIASLGGLIVFSPIIIVVAILVRVNLGSPILFTQDRVGKNNKIFKMMKFRTMKDGVDKDGKLLPDSERLTNFGKILRSTSLDELPELVNILKGDMSLIGPRPLLVEYLLLYSEEQKRRHNVLPGLTGWAQINGRNAISWGEKFKLDVYYVNNWSLGLDLKIFFLTFYKLFNREGINQEGESTVEDFNGFN
ncbi:sugar transferase [Clostridium perfringens]|uniref:sugar transferase n=1 Tax=Clostridium perfringens TaxID=1502 RepID=UPI0018E403A9|nr:sugar transferase [Clostridium perfringens]MBI6011099.1 sugar transferase [Clostridium perfringens]MDG6887078.1 Undecaprenyl phosphate NN'-diacetylbacillosamine 1-phosphate transferase [Clostridium perfringens]MDH5086779.1 Undecaprenyl phosphate NN'-diacetylbacillosamine 1-phosphate transferase [Clostridium perfringens]MDK0767701.1 sugar transferase [Clostridium perfringens]MDK0770348.1 sugar transferase [Clostridium perfringens]